MSEQLVNANGHSAGVTSAKRLMVEAIGYDYGLAVALEKGLAFTAHDATVTPTGAGDYFAKIANTSSDYVMVINGFRARCTAGDVVGLDLGANYTSATSHAEIVPVNRLVGSTILAASYGQFESDVDITGQGAQVEIHQITLAAAADGSIDCLSAAPIVLQVNQALSLRAVTGTSPISFSVDFYFAAVPYENA